MIAIIGAMEEEVQAVLNQLQNVEIVSDTLTKVYKGNYKHHTIIVAQSGIGKVNAALTTYSLIKEHSVDCIINIGTAGGLKTGIKQLDLVIANELVQHDFDVSGGVTQRVVGEIPGLPKRFNVSTELKAACLKAVEELSLVHHVGLIASGDQFIHEMEHYNTILNHFPDCMAVDMEAAAIAQTCFKMNIPYIITRCISDVVYEDDNGLTFDQYLNKASILSAKLCFATIDSIM